MGTGDVLHVSEGQAGTLPSVGIVGIELQHLQGKARSPAQNPDRAAT
ncbi:hypothetical protein [Microcoleus sp. PH2017_02_FOX_O_A]|nr:hypothetical protein [Microcoleus sp. PH2017_02_FOX_O_A]MCC3444051.1 hypothetical protein [Microcoleus sp. PH2017_03_ELD_O_A]MCC3450904.1 hypothetical protein [Microcoleus sp. PH2017_09_SFU_O_A]MCC3505754.1 hypothetical protein [Microcoleus sp. PH2017_19_SFW_U_A]MCC3512068.1 hypothetical protein [Microcoleus sp. PH2017_17_BER_D_A]MCC3524037.1 hypothetical protein [Microcoleus sp. PH2017_20_SFW_D_A]MCC3550654.1 hypothetical protein [Microcoleus sp. PH2017_24_DOB_U_A]MCC3626546.1 hypothetic